MRAHHYLAIAVKLFAIALFVFAMRELGLLGDILVDEGLVSNAYSALLLSYSVVLPLLFSALLWFFPLTISKKIIGPEFDYDVRPINLVSILSALVATMGLYFLYQVISDSSYWAIYSYLSSRANTALALDAQVSMWVTAIEAMVSFVLIFKSQSIALRLSRVSG